ncbi:PAS domain S-box protein [Piscinibacter sp.]|uniref:PAS domain S-box protein n=1 Tax=Piscinibacter sp. TaxID=1903157 RepID=UPI00355A00CB
MKFSFDRKLLAGLAISVLVFTIVGALGMRSIDRLRDDVARTERTHEVQVQLAVVLATLSRLESEQRGQLLTGEASYQSAYDAAAAQLPGGIEHLAALTSDHPGQQQLIAKLRLLVDERRAQLSQVERSARTGGIAAAASAIRSGDGKRTMDAVRSVLARMADEEERLLAQGRAAERDSFRNNLQLAGALGAAAALLLGALYVSIRREMATREQLNRLGAEANATLQLRVEERTRSLQQAATALSYSEARLRGIINAATDAILTADETQHIVMANPAAAAMFQRPVEQLLGSPLSQLIPERFRAQHRRDVDAFGADGKTARSMGRQSELWGLRGDGTEFPIEASISALSEGDKKLYTVIVRDITERARLESAIRESEEHNRRLIANLPMAVLVNKHNRISYVNEAATRLFGTDEATMLTMSPLDLIHPDSVQLVRERIAQLLAGADALPPVEEKIARPDGSVAIVETTATRFEDHGEPAILVVMRDVTELKTMHNALEQTHSDLQSLAKVKASIQENERKRVARELHDELGQHLSALKMDLASLRTTTDRDAVAARAAAMQELLDQTVASVRRIAADMRPLMLDDLGLNAAIEWLAHEAARRMGIEVDLDLDESEALLNDQAVIALYRMVQEALTNVARHAHASHVWIEMRHRAGDLVLVVQDDGVGFGPQALRKKGSYGLMGLRERASMFGGQLEVENPPDGGGRVTVRLPLSRLNVDSGPAPLVVDTP